MLDCLPGWPNTHNLNLTNLTIAHPGHHQQAALKIEKFGDLILKATEPQVGGGGIVTLASI